MKRSFGRWPGLDAGLAFSWRRPPLPLLLAAFGIERDEEAADVHRVAAYADEQVVLDDERRSRREILKPCIGDLFSPAFLAVARVETDHPVVRPEEVQPFLI